MGYPNYFFKAHYACSRHCGQELSAAALLAHQLEAAPDQRHAFSYSLQAIALTRSFVLWPVFSIKAAPIITDT